MGYLFLMVALVAGATKGFCGKKTSGYTDTFGSAILANGIRMALCILIGFAVILAKGELAALWISRETLWISLLSGVSSAVFVVAWLISVKGNAYMLLEIFLLLGTLIPLLGSNIFFGENIRVNQWLGMVLLLGSVVIMCSYNNSIKKKISIPSFLLLLVCGIASGIADFSQKIFVKKVLGGSVAVFNFYTYLVAFLVLMIPLFLMRKTLQGTDKASMKKMMIFIPIMAICLFVNSFFKTLAADHLDAILLYPLNQGCALILSTLMAILLFKEKANFKAILGIAIAFVGLLIINLL